MLSSVEAIKGVLGIPDADVSQDGYLQAHLTAADALVKTYCKRQLEVEVSTRYPRPSGQTAQALPERPIWQYRISTTFTEGSDSATVDSDEASGLLVGMPAVATDYVPVGTTLTAISGGTLTLSEEAIASGTITATYGLAVWLDVLGADGQRSGSFDEATFLDPGQDYMLDQDSRDGNWSSRSGLIVRISGPVAGVRAAGLDWWGSYGTGRRGTLTAKLPPVWPDVPGSLKVVMTAGYYPDAIPADLAMAVNMMAIHFYRVAGLGGVQLPGSESYRNYSVSLSIINGDPAMGSVRQILARYRELSL